MTEGAQRLKEGEVMKINFRKVRILQATQGLTVNELLKKAEIPRGTWCYSLSQKRAGIKTASKLADALECTLEDITDEE